MRLLGTALGILAVFATYALFAAVVFGWWFV